MDLPLRNFAQKAAEKNPATAGDYVVDGILYCGKCHTAKQTTFVVLGKPYRVACMCKCYEAARETRIVEERVAEAEKNRRDASGVPRSDTFETARMSADLRKCLHYAERWEKAQSENIGLLLWGDIGTGKTFAAHCICNALMQRREPVSVYATSLARYLNSGFDKTEVLDKIRWKSLVVLDDLGAERGSDYAVENVFTLVDERYKAKKPLIVTSNVTLEEMKKPTITLKDGSAIPDIRRKRIYDRVLEMCVPVYFSGTSKRGAIAECKKADIRSFILD